MFRKKRVYLDYASSTPTDARVIKYMHTFENNLGGNPNAIHSEGRSAKKVLEGARKFIATNIAARPEEVIFTSGGTESNNLVIFGAFQMASEYFKNSPKKPHIIISSIEHKSILEPVAALIKLGAEVTYIEPDKEGIIDPSKVGRVLREETVLVSIIYAHNEIGTIEPILEIGKEIRRAKKRISFIIPEGPYFHTDACQAMQFCDLNVGKLGIDLMSLHSPKIYGPAGIGALFVRRGREIAPQILGGGQENRMRSGRELPLLAAGFARAFEISIKEKDKETKRLIDLRDYFIKRIFEIYPKSRINGSMDHRLPGNINVCIFGLDAEFAVVQLDELGIACSHASTCMNTSKESYSYVVKAIKPNENCETSSLRFSLGRSTTKSDVNFCLKALSSILLTQWNISQNNK